MKRTARRNLRQAITAASAAIFTAFLIYTAFSEDGSDWKYHIQKRILLQAQQMYLPALSWVNRAPATGIIEYSYTLGTIPRSHMCVRNATSHAKFIFEWAPVNETIIFVLDQ